MSPVVRTAVVESSAGDLRAAFTDENPETADALWDALPQQGEARRWGQEVYFDVDVALPPEGPREVLEVGEIGYWPAGPAVALFFGPTPASRGEEPRAASGVNVFARFVDDATRLEAVRPGETVVLRRA